MSRYVVGVDLGGTKVEACLMDRERKVYKRYHQLGQASQGMDRVIENIRAVIREASGEKPYAAVGLGTPGTYNPGEVPLIPARLGDSAGVMGAAYLALRQQGTLSF